MTLAAILSLAALLTGCGSSEQETSETDIVAEESEGSAAIGTWKSQTMENEEENSEMKMNVQVGGSNFTATLEENEAVDALVEMMEQGPVTIQMSDYPVLKKSGLWERAFLPATSKPPRRPGTLCCIRAIKLSCSTALIHGAIPGWATLMILLAGKRLWEAAM